MGSTRFDDLRGGNRAGGGILRGVSFGSIGAAGNPTRAGAPGRGVFYYFDDFHTYDATDVWTANTNGAGAAQSAAVVAHGHGGLLRLATGTTQNTGEQVELDTGFGVLPTANRFFGMLVRFRVSVATDTNVVFAFVPQQGATDLAAGSGGIDTTITDYIALSGLTSGGTSTALQLQSRFNSGTARTTGAITGMNLADNTFVTAGFRVNCGSAVTEAAAVGSVEVYFNGRRALVATPGLGTTPTVVLPSIACGFGMAATIKDAGGASRSLDVDWVYLFGERA